MSKKIVFLTGTRADFGKLKPLINKVEKSDQFENYVFVTGMHMLEKFGSTINEVKKEGYKNIFSYKNQNGDVDMDIILSNTITGFSEYIKKVRPDLIVVHGDRVETLAGAIVGALNNILVAHVEGGELSGTVDELIRHSVTKLSHIHFVANQKAKKRVIQLGEKKESVFVIGSPDLDVMLDENLPELEKVKEHYEIPFERYAVFCYHPVTTELDSLEKNITTVVGALKESGRNYVVIYPNNDHGSEIIIEKISRLEDERRFRVFPSLRFERFLTLLKNADFIIGNTSAGIREAGFYAVPSIDIGSRQNNRSHHKGIVKVGHSKEGILGAIKKAETIKIEKTDEFGDGRSADRFIKIISQERVWTIPSQKQFVDFN